MSTDCPWLTFAVSTSDFHAVTPVSGIAAAWM